MYHKLTKLGSSARIFSVRQAGDYEEELQSLISSSLEVLLVHLKSYTGIWLLGITVATTRGWSLLSSSLALHNAIKLDVILSRYQGLVRLASGVSVCDDDGSQIRSSKLTAGSRRL